MSFRLVARSLIVAIAFCPLLSTPGMSQPSGVDPCKKVEGVFQIKQKGRCAIRVEFPESDGTKLQFLFEKRKGNLVNLLDEQKIGKKVPFRVRFNRKAGKVVIFGNGETSAVAPYAIAHKGAPFSSFFIATESISTSNIKLIRRPTPSKTATKTPTRTNTPTNSSVKTPINGSTPTNTPVPRLKKNTPTPTKTSTPATALKTPTKYPTATKTPTFSSSPCPPDSMYVLMGGVPYCMCLETGIYFPPGSSGSCYGGGSGTSPTKTPTKSPTPTIAAKTPTPNPTSPVQTPTPVQTCAPGAIHGCSTPYPTPPKYTVSPSPTPTSNPCPSGEVLHGTECGPKDQIDMRDTVTLSSNSVYCNVAIGYVDNHNGGVDTVYYPYDCTFNIIVNRSAVSEAGASSGLVKTITDSANNSPVPSGSDPASPVCTKIEMALEDRFASENGYIKSSPANKYVWEKVNGVPSTVTASWKVYPSGPSGTTSCNVQISPTYSDWK